MLHLFLFPYNVEYRGKIYFGSNWGSSPLEVNQETTFLRSNKAKPIAKVKPKTVRAIPSFCKGD